MAQNPADVTSQDPYDPFALARALDDCAKWWWGASFIFKLYVFVAGLFVMLPFFADDVPFLVAALSLLSELSSYRSEVIRSSAQRIRRNLDFQDSFGWQMSDSEMSDLLMRCPRSVKKRANADKAKEPYFASSMHQGSLRALQNLSESAWWSKHLSETMFSICLTVLILWGAAAFFLLAMGLQAIGQSDTRASVARIVTATLMLMLSTGIFRLTWGYYGFAQNAARSEQAATWQIDSGRCDDTEAIKIMNEYHVARALGPIIPTWVWKLRRNELNATWRRYRSKPDRGSQTLQKGG